MIWPKPFFLNNKTTIFPISKFDKTFRKNISKPVLQSSHFSWIFTGHNTQRAIWSCCNSNFYFSGSILNSACHVHKIREKPTFHAIPSSIHQIQHFQSNPTDFHGFFPFKLFQQNQTPKQHFSTRLIKLILAKSKEPRK